MALMNQSLTSEQNAFIAALPRDFFHAGNTITIARAPGRLDVMGGISDYSGGLCLEWPLECATFCAVQPTTDGTVEVRSADAADSNFSPRVAVPTTSLQHSNLNAAAVALPDAINERWARYVLGIFPVLQHEAGAQFSPASGARIFIDSQVPMGAGLASSAALEVAAMTAINAAFELRLEPMQIARLCQRVENVMVGAPCGIMDQVTSALGRKGQLLRLLCQPDVLEGYEELPPDLLLFGVDSGVKHSVGGGAYGTARCGAFMGRRILQELLPNAMAGADSKQYLSNLSTDIWRSVRERIPDKLSGSDFLSRYDSHDDTATVIEEGRTFNVRLATEHPIYETDRVRRFALLLRAARANEAARDMLLSAAGDLMVQSHFSYDHRCNLGSHETDLLVRIARETGQHAGIIGAKITGGGAGGTVAILADGRKGNVAATVRWIADAYAAKTGCKPSIWSGSSDGAGMGGVIHATA